MGDEQPTFLLYDHFDKSLYRLVQTDGTTIAGIERALQISNSNTRPSDIGDGVITGTLVIQENVIEGGKTKFDNTENGFILGSDKGTYKFYIGNSTSYFNWDGTTVTVSGTITASTIIGTLIETSSGTGARIVIDSNADSLTVYDASNNSVVVIKPSASGTLVNISPSGATQPALTTSNLAGVNYTGTSLVTFSLTNPGSTSGDVLTLTQAGTGNPLKINGATVSTHFKKEASFDGVTLWKSDGTTPNGNLSGTAGDVCINADSSQSYYCTGTTNWTAFKFTSPLTTKGDIFVFDSANNRLPVGADGTHLVSDSGQTAGVGWIPPTVKVCTTFDVAGKFVITNIGVGTSTFDVTGWTGTTSAAGGSSLKNVWQISNGNNPGLYNAGGTFTVMMLFNDGAAPTNTSEAFAGLGTPAVAAAGHTWTDDHIGFKFTWDGTTRKMYASTAASGTETATLMLNGFTNAENLDLVFFIESSSKVLFWVRETGGTFGAATIITTNIPTSNTKNSGQFSVSNMNTFHSATINTFSASFER